MRLTVNGKPVQLPEGSTIVSLLGQLSIEASRVAIERNQDVVPRATWGEATLADGDQIEIVTFVGGG